MMSDYPETPGHRGVATSIEAAESIADDVRAIRGRALRFIRSVGRSGATSDEVAAALSIPNHYSSRPRLSELRQMREIKDSGRKRPNLSGRNAIVWVASEFYEHPPIAEAA